MKHFITIEVSFDFTEVDDVSGKELVNEIIEILLDTGMENVNAKVISEHTTEK